LCGYPVEESDRGCKTAFTFWLPFSKYNSASVISPQSTSLHILNAQAQLCLSTVYLSYMNRNSLLSKCSDKDSAICIKMRLKISNHSVRILLCVLLILRRQNLFYELIGDCYVHGNMDGEVIDKMGSTCNVTKLMSFTLL
jgi:hypothetical protein